MLKAIRLSIVCVLLACAQVATGKTPAPLARSHQLIVVTTRGWDDVPGTLRRFERKGTKGAWAEVGADVPVAVGRNGLGWGAGLVDTSGTVGPLKKEGDGKAPAGVFALGSAFGFVPFREAAWLRVPYVPLTSSVECVDDVASSRYNLIVDREAVGAADWNSSERMRSVEGYRWGLVVKHNAAPPVAGRGSCIFLHIWAGPGRGTAGCTAMEEASLTELLRWLDPKKRPLLVQLPEGEYTRLSAAWRLPALAFEK
ncbi:MAG: zinc D-Ala-D-Ala dipeptidase [Acidobacteriota bacterium]|jgi:D-alanyl-D-alanine dipeptidase|nr:zinc D-Ala-D-Ala dipeptidase [Acidobacteriota bacterium]